MKKNIALALSLLLLFFAGCKKEQKPDDIPAVYALGFIGEEKITTGGTSGESSDMNAKALAITTSSMQDQTETILEFSFVSGSRMSGSTEEKSGHGVPSFTVYVLNNPARLVVQFENLAFWDYRHNLALDNPLIRGYFQQTIFESPKLSIYFQLSQPVYYMTEIVDDILRIHLVAYTQEDKELYYVTANAYDAYRSGVISLEFNAAPTFASDMQNILLISPPMETEEEAALFLANTRQQYPAILEEQWRLQKLTGQQLPDFDKALNFLAAEKKPVIRFNDGRIGTLPLLLPDGNYLCSLPNYDGFLYNVDLNTEDGQDTYQQLYIMQRNGLPTLATTFDFSAIEQANYSPDGRKLAVLDRASDGASRLYIFDANTFELLNDLSEMGFGDSTSTFIWNSLGNTLYAITGSGGVQLHQFDYSIPDEAKRHSLIDRNSVDEGSLGFCDGELYFTQASEAEGSMIYRIKPEGGVRKRFIQGNRFAISSDASYMAIARSREGDAPVTSSSAIAKQGLYLYELATGNTITISEKIYPYDFIWSKDCKKLYYIENRISGGQTEEDTSTGPETQSTPANEDPYPFTLWVYDMLSAKSEKLFDLSAPDLITAETAGILYLNHYETTATGSAIRSCYMLDLNSVFASGSVATPDEQTQNSDTTEIK